MKKFFAVLLSICVILSMVACSSNPDKESTNKDNDGKTPTATIDKNDANNSDKENQKPTIEKLPQADPAKYESDSLKVYDGKYYDVFQGHIKAVSLSFLNDEVIYADDTVFKRSVNDAIWYRWKVGTNKTIVTYDMGLILVADENGNVTEYRYTDINKDTGEMTTSTEELPVKLDEILYAACGGSEYYVLKQNGVVYYQEKGKSINPTEDEEKPKPFYGQIGAREPMPIDDFFVLSDFEQIVLIDDTAYKFQRSDVNFKDGKAILNLKEVELKNVQRLIDINSSYAFVIENEDDKYIWAYSMMGFDNKKEAKIEVPDGYTTDDVVGFIHANDGVLIFKFDDGKYFELSSKDFDDENLETAHTMALNETISSLAKNEHFVDICGDASNVYILMDDGYLYIVK